MTSVAHLTPQAQAAPASRHAALPEETDARLLRQLRDLLGGPVSFRTNVEMGGGDLVYTRGLALPAGISPAALEQARKLIESSMAPASERELSAALLKIRLLAKRPRTSDADEKAMALLLIDELRAYPRDVALDALDTFKRSTFFPAWGEIAKVCDDLVKDRRAMLRAIECEQRSPTPVSVKPMPRDPAAWDRARERHGLPPREAPKPEQRRREALPPDRDTMTAAMLVRDHNSSVAERFLLARMEGADYDAALAAARESKP